MKWIRCFMSSSIGRKQVMALTGLALCGFLVSHVIGNFTMLISDEAFNLYAHTLTSNPLIYGAEAVLLLLFLSHIVLGGKLTAENFVARPQRYFMKIHSGRGATFASSTMIWTGLIALIFLVWHLLDFKYGTNYTATYDGVEIRDLYRTVMKEFANPIVLTRYIVAMIALGIHVSHGFSSAFQSLGLNHPKYTPLLNKLGVLFGLFVTFSYSGLAIWCHLQGRV